MRVTAAYAISSAQSHSGDPGGQFATTQKLIPLLAAAQKEIILKVFSNETVTGIQGIVVVPNIPLGTTSLAAQFDAQVGPLRGLIEIISMKERAAGSDEGQWIPMSPTLGDLPTVKTASNDYNAVFKWMGNDILLPGSDRAEDFRIFGEFEPSNIVDPTSMLIPRSEEIMGRLAAAYLTRSRNAALSRQLMAEAEDLMDNLFAALCREKQDTDIHQVPNPGYPDEPFYI